MSPIDPEQARRVRITTAVRDTDVLPKVPGAGTLLQRDGRPLQVMHNGMVIEEGCYYGDWMTEIIRNLRGHHEPQEELVFAAILDRLAADATANVIVELGSFWAYYAMWAMIAIAGLRAILVEPDPNNLEVGRRNLALNGLDGRFVHAAVGPRHDATIALRCESDGVVRDLRAITVDGLVRQERLDRIDILVCDTQGAEVDMLRGARETMAAGALRFALVSTHHHSISGDRRTHEICLDLLRDAGAHIIAQHTVSESCSGDGLIAASLDPRDAGFRVEVSTVAARDSLFGEDLGDR